MKLSNEVVAQLKADHPEEWERLQKHIYQYKNLYGDYDEGVALFFYSAGVRDTAGILNEVGQLLKNIPAI